MEFTKDLSQILNLCRLCLNGFENGKNIFAYDSLGITEDDSLPSLIFKYIGISVSSILELFFLFIFLQY